MKQYIVAGVALALLISPTIASATGAKLNAPGQLKARLAIEDREENKNEEKKEVKAKVERPQMKTVVGTVTTINGTTLTLTTEKKTYTVDASGASIVRNYGASMTVAEIQVNDKLSVWGQVSDGTNIKGTWIRDLSFQAFRGDFRGQVKTINATASTTLTSFTLETANRGIQTINVVSTTIFQKNGVTVQPSELMVGATVQVSGVWNRANDNVTAKKVNIIAKQQQIQIRGTVIAATDPNASPIANNSFQVKASNGKIYTVDISHGVLVGKDYRFITQSDLKAGNQVAVGAIQLNSELNVTGFLVRNLSI